VIPITARRAALPSGGDWDLSGRQAGRNGRRAGFKPSTRVGSWFWRLVRQGTPFVRAAELLPGAGPAMVRRDVAGTNVAPVAESAVSCGGASAGVLPWVTLPTP
jgi:hypothetical protein